MINIAITPANPTNKLICTILVYNSSNLLLINASSITIPNDAMN